MLISITAIFQEIDGITIKNLLILLEEISDSGMV